jgi:hypothetical protein
MSPDAPRPPAGAEGQAIAGGAIESHGNETMGHHPGDVYGARPVKRRRATKAEMAERAEVLTRLAAEHGPCSVRHLYYAAVVAGVPGIEKDDAGYNKVQRQVLALRRSGAITYSSVVDSTRWQRKPRSYDSVEEALAATAAHYRRNLWATSSWRVEVWCESDSIASTIYKVTARWDVPLMVCRGYSSETFAYNAAQAWRSDDRVPVVLYVGDHDADGLNIETDLYTRLTAFYDSHIDWMRVGVTWDQVEALDLPGRPPKRSRRRTPYPYPLAVEAEALPAGHLREILDEKISSYTDIRALDVLRVAEASERDLLTKMANRGAA